MKRITLWMTITETGKAHFDVPDDVSHEEFLNNPWEYLDEFVSKSVDHQKLDLRDAREFWPEGGES